MNRENNNQSQVYERVTALVSLANPKRLYEKRVQRSILKPIAGLPKEGWTAALNRDVKKNAMGLGICALAMVGGELTSDFIRFPETAQIASVPIVLALGMECLTNAVLMVIKSSDTIEIEFHDNTLHIEFSHNQARQD